MKFLGTLFLFTGYSLIYAAVARGGLFATDPWNGVLSDAYTSVNLTGGNPPAGNSSSGSGSGSVGTGLSTIGSGTGASPTQPGANPPIVNRKSIKSSGGINVSPTSNIGGRNRGTAPPHKSKATSKYDRDFNRGFNDAFRGLNNVDPMNTAYTTGYNAGYASQHPLSSIFGLGRL